MFHVKHYSLISNFYNKNNCSIIKNVPLDSLIDLIYSNKKKKIIFYNDILYNQIVDQIDIEWEQDSTLILAPKDQYSSIAPPGFNQYNRHSVEYFTKIYSSFKKDIQAILCPESQKNIVINKGHYNIFKITSIY